MVLTTRDDVAERVRLLRDHGSPRKYVHVELGYSSRLDELQAALLRVKLAHLAEWTEAAPPPRRALPRAAWPARGLGLPAERPPARHVYHQFAVRAPRRDALAAALAARGVGTAVHYPTHLALPAALLPPRRRARLSPRGAGGDRDARPALLPGDHGSGDRHGRERRAPGGGGSVGPVAPIRARQRRAGAPITGSSQLRAAVASLRPRQWVKNLFVFAAVIFSQNLFTPARLAGARGLRHLLRALRRRSTWSTTSPTWTRTGSTPSSGTAPSPPVHLPRRTAAAFAVALLLAEPRRGVWPVPAVRSRRPRLRRAPRIAYSFWLKHIVILDVLTVAMGFVLRAVAGAEAVDVDISGWLVICTILIALFLALGKRRQEYLTLARRRGGPSARPRRVQRGLPRPDDRGRHRLHRDRVCPVHDVAGDGGQVPHAPPADHAALRALRDLPLPLPALPSRARRQSRPTCS